jgi:hypothetical protein
VHPLYDLHRYHVSLESLPPTHLSAFSRPAFAYPIPPFTSCSISFFNLTLLNYIAPSHLIRTYLLMALHLLIALRLTLLLLLVDMVQDSLNNKSGRVKDRNSDLEFQGTCLSLFIGATLANSLHFTQNLDLGCEI